MKQRGQHRLSSLVGFTPLSFFEEEEKLRPTRVDRLPTLLAG